MTLNKYLSVWLRLSSFYTFIILWRCGRCAWWVVLKKGGNFFGWEKKEFLPILVGDFELGREEHPLISKSGVSQLWFNRGVCSSFFRDLNAVIRVDVYFGQTGEEGRPVSYGRWRFYGSCQLLEGYRKPLYQKFPFGISPQKQLVACLQLSQVSQLCGWYFTSTYFLGLLSQTWGSHFLWTGLSRYIRGLPIWSLCRWAKFPCVELYGHAGR